LADTLAATDTTLAELETRAQHKDFADLTEALQRVRRIVPAETSSRYDADQLTEPAEVALHDAYRKVIAQLGETTTFTEFADAARELVAPINHFFDEVLVMAEDPKIRNTRLGLLASIRDLAESVLDWHALGTALNRQ
jgi:glycyl-tRNA synthetase